MKNLLVIVAIVFIASCNDGYPDTNFNNCKVIKWDSLATDQKYALTQAGIDSTKCTCVQP